MKGLGIDVESEPVPAEPGTETGSFDNNMIINPLESEHERKKNLFVQTVELWISEIDKSQKVLEDRVQDNNTTATPGGVWPYEMSLVATYATTATATTTCEPETSKFVTHASATKNLPKASVYNVNGCATLLIVAWQDAKHFVGRVCDLRDGKVLALVPARHSAMDFSDCEIVLNTIHLRPHKEGPKGRPDLPSLAMRLYKMYDAAMTRQSAGRTESLTIDPCVWCKQCCGKISTSTPTIESTAITTTTQKSTSCTVTQSNSASAASDVSTDLTTTTSAQASSSSSLSGNPEEEGESIFICSVCLLPCHLSCSIQAFKKH